MDRQRRGLWIGAIIGWVVLGLITGHPVWFVFGCVVGVFTPLFIDRA